MHEKAQSEDERRLRLALALRPSGPLGTNVSLPVHGVQSQPQDLRLLMGKALEQH